MVAPVPRCCPLCERLLRSMKLELCPVCRVGRCTRCLATGAHERDGLCDACFRETRLPFLPTPGCVECHAADPVGSLCGTCWELARDREKVEWLREFATEVIGVEPRPLPKEWSKKSYEDRIGELRRRASLALVDFRQGE